MDCELLNGFLGAVNVSGAVSGVEGDVPNLE